MSYTYYLDTSALVKRYVTEPGSDLVDRVFRDAYRGAATVALSHWNLAEAAVVFDRYGRRLGLDARAVLRSMLRELRTLARLQGARVIGVTPPLLRASINIVMRSHVYVADALQVASARGVSADEFLTGDRALAEVASREGLKVTYVG